MTSELTFFKALLFYYVKRLLMNLKSVLSMSAESDQVAQSMAVSDLEEAAKDFEPYVVEGATLMSPGEWNGMVYRKDEIEAALSRTDWENRDENNALFLDHKDRQVSNYVGTVENLRMEGEDLKGDLVIRDLQTAINLENDAKFGVSPKVVGSSSDGKSMEDFEFRNFSVVVNPAVKTTYLNQELSDKRSEVENTVTHADELQEDPDLLTGEHTMTQENQEQGDDPAPEEDAGDDRTELSEDALRDIVESVIDDKLSEQEDAEAEDEPEEEVENEAESEEDAAGDDFAEFAAEYRDENPDASPADVASAYEEAQKTPEDKLEEMQSDLESKIDDLRSELESKEETIEEMSEKVDDSAQRASVRDPSALKEAREEVEELSIDELDKKMTAKMAQEFGYANRGN